MNTSLVTFAVVFGGLMGLMLFVVAYTKAIDWAIAWTKEEDASEARKLLPAEIPTLSVG